MSAPSKQAAANGPVIPERYLDIPSQRLYVLSLGCICQAVKVLDFFRSFASSDLHLCTKWLLFDLAYVVMLKRLRIPRLTYSTAAVILQIMLLWMLNGFLFGGLHLNLAAVSGSSQSSSPHSDSSGYLSFLAPLTFGLIGADYSTSDSHLLGQHTVRMSPISTAHLNSEGYKFCLAPSSDSVLIPILLNNTSPASIRYTLIPLGSQPSEAQTIDVSSRELRGIEQAREASLQLTRPSTNHVADEYDEYDDDDEDDLPYSRQSSLQKTQSLAHIRLSKPGRIRLERVLDSHNIEARLGFVSEMVVAPCPQAQFISERFQETRCIGQEPEVQMTLDITGVPPLSLRWFKTINGKSENYLVEGIQGNEDSPHNNQPGYLPAPQNLRVPLSVMLDKVGSHIYGLEEITDAVGNAIRVDSATGHATDTMRTFNVLRKPSVSFKNCGPGNPTSVLIGSEAPLTIGTNDADILDAPWEMVLKYLPPSSQSKGDKRFKPWQKTFRTEDTKTGLIIPASAPGEYTIMQANGKFCEGDVLAPETCLVIERPLPTAEIEWKKIHECSGDTGVSATLVLHGTPPFQVYYRVQRDNEPPRELSKTFTSSRGELTIQPEQSGHYTFSFLQISDNFYRKVDLKGPSIDQVIHPLAAADFVGGRGGSGKRLISSCAGGTVDVDVELRGTGPWNLDVQVVGPKGSDILTFSDIESPQKTLQIPVPSKIDKDGGAFEINLISIEDKYKCRRPLAVPAVSVDVRRIKPTVRFYGEEEKRRVTVLESEQAKLPLRLTGDGPWRIKYVREDAENQVLTAKLSSVNDYLTVTSKGLYRILDVADSQCPGSVIANGATYEVDWVPRPSAKLSPKTKAVYESYNGSYILQPICQGVQDHVDLDLLGRPPFQIMYNIAYGTHGGGTKLLDQPTFHSIQPHTRFQLQTNSPGRLYYEVKQVGDAAYPLANHKARLIPPSERLLFEQQVSVRPVAAFKTRNRMAYCLNERFTPLDNLSSDGVVVFEGTPPFTLTMTIKNMMSSETETVIVQTNDYHWKIDLPEYEFGFVGAHQVIIKSVSDASSCEHATLDPLSTSLWVDVAETAAIVPFDRRDDFCVGDVALFQLEGTPPWSVGYRVNGKAHTQEVKVSPFSLAQQSPGEVAITSIAHQQKKCKASVTDLRFSVHPLPSAQVGHGKRVYQDIHEGDQAEIVFTLVGTPPFTFTYQRSEPVLRKGAKPGKVLETHTVSKIFAHEYSIFSALEGTWTVTSISDKYCRYPQTQLEDGR